MLGRSLKCRACYCVSVNAVKADAALNSYEHNLNNLNIPLLVIAPPAATILFVKILRQAVSNNDLHLTPSIGVCSCALNVYAEAKSAQIGWPTILRI